MTDWVLLKVQRRGQRRLFVRDPEAFWGENHAVDARYTTRVGCAMIYDTAAAAEAARGGRDEVVARRDRFY